MRDLDGAQLSYRGRRAEVLLMRGAPVNSNLAPGLEGVDRRPDDIQGGSLQLKPHQHLGTGFSVVSYDIGGHRETGAAFNAGWRLAPVLARIGLEGTYLDLSGVYAQRGLELDRFFSLSRALGRALYLAATMTSGSWGLSLEYKDYRDFALEHINNPPPLIREHSAYLLNRNTHDLLADDEEGYQAELSYSLPGGQILTANATRATRRRGPGPDDDRKAARVLRAARFTPGQQGRGPGHRRLQPQPDSPRREKPLPGHKLDLVSGPASHPWFDAQFQDVDRSLGTLALPYTNHFLALEVHRSPGLSAAVQVQRTSDELETGADPSGVTWWRGLNLGADVGEGHSVHVFAGQRRSGLACTAGICYEVLGFEGVEVRLLNRFF